MLACTEQKRCFKQNCIKNMFIRTKSLSADLHSDNVKFPLKKKQHFEVDNFQAYHIV